MLIYAIIKLLKVINIKSHENCSWLFFCAKKEDEEFKKTIIQAVL